MATYYVDFDNGNDGNTGLVGAPWKNLSYAEPDGSGGVTSGDTVIISAKDDGSAYSAFVYQTAENQTDWIYYQAASGENPKCAGLRLGSGTTHYNYYLDFDNIDFDKTGTNGVKNGCTIYAEYRDNLAFHNLTITGDHDITTRVSPLSDSCFFFGTDNLTIDNCVFVGHDFGLSLKTTATVTVQGTEFNANTVCIYVQGITSDITIDDCNLHDFTSDGIVLNSTGVTIQDTSIHDADTPGGSAWHMDGIQTQPGSDDTVIRRCKIWNLAIGNAIKNHQAILAQNGTHTIENCLIYNIWSTTDLNYDGSGNHFHLSGDADSKYNNNTVLGRIDIWTGIEEFNNNIAYRIFLQTGEVADPSNYDYNIGVLLTPNYTPAANDTTLADQDALEALFNDYDNDDFSLASDSVAIGHADSLYAPSVDILGNTRDANPDAGAYEYIGGSSFSRGKGRRVLRR